MKRAHVFGWILSIAVAGLAGQRATAQDTIRAAIPLFPTAAFPLLVAADRGFFQKEGVTVEPIRINRAPTWSQSAAGTISCLMSG